jgi:hypothetical protein
MNERIRLLALQAGLKMPINTEYNGHIYRNALEKFAELIVRECVKIGDNYQDILGNEPECVNCRKVAYGIVDQIKQHFGVES